MNKERDEVYKAFGLEKNLSSTNEAYAVDWHRLCRIIENIWSWHTVYSCRYQAHLYSRYGNEIGMGDDLGLNEQMSVRTPMPWSSQRNGSFSSAENIELDTGVFSVSKVNVANQLQDSASLLTWTNRIIRLRKQCLEFGYGSSKIIETDPPNTVAIVDFSQSFPFRRLSMMRLFV